MSVTIQTGLPPALREKAAEIYWEAFGSKLGRVMGPEPKARRYLMRVIDASHVIVALDDRGALLGMAGFKTPHGAFADGSLGELRAVYGLVGAGWRMAVLRLLHNEVDNERFLIDGICVARGARGRGIGTALIAALCDEGRARGYAAIRLDVIDTNLRAKALYQRLGFAVLHSETIGPLRYIFGFSAATAMAKPL